MDEFSLSAPLDVVLSNVDNIWESVSINSINKVDIDVYINN